ncbi:FadR/GntR family transcriptional regulator [Aurantimonas sp. HBX-1]|uniref:FadR/GntR family transcriptional regulator n=1 Tax=Aurantimonas sp. HBX-1 TaxID=2906072 RepID=UPI001F21DB44|nr:FadR/GntR family transcriptional regulator [Aurantimonas sp. HBX-1]UIJ73444.1 FadR family transcriptional regulator [Aurantimonas sp. HBX-1]
MPDEMSTSAKPDGIEGTSQRRRLEHDIRPAQQRRLGDEVFEALARLITTGELALGSKLPAEGELCRLFAVSRPVVRAALARLRDDGLVESRKGSGSYVLGLGAEEPDADPRARLGATLRALEFRRSIEPDAAYYASLRRSPGELRAIETALANFEETIRTGDLRRRVDYEFHLSIAEASQNIYYVTGLSAIEYDIDLGQKLARDLSQLGQSERRRSIFVEHKAIFEAIERQDPPGAKRAMEIHLEHSQLRVISRGEEIVRRADAGARALSLGLPARTDDT